MPTEGLRFLAEEFMRVDVWNSVASLTVNIEILFLRSNGVTVPSTFVVSPTSDRIVNTSATVLGTGHLLALRVRAAGATVRRGQCFVRISRLATIASVDRVVEQITNGYLVDDQFLSYPATQNVSPIEGPATLREILGTNPALGVEISEAVPTNARWLLHRFRSVLITSGTAGTRTIRLAVDRGLSPSLVVEASVTQAANQTLGYSIATAGFAPPATAVEFYFAVGQPIPMAQGDRIFTSTLGLQADDNWETPFLVVEEWIEE